MIEVIKTYSIKGKDFEIYRAYHFLLCDSPPFIFKLIPLIVLQRYLEHKVRRFYTFNQIKYSTKKLIKMGLLERKLMWNKKKTQAQLRKHLIKESYYRITYY